MYLVEEFKDALHLQLPLRSLEQAISNVQASPVHHFVLLHRELQYTCVCVATVFPCTPWGCGAITPQVIDEFAVHRTTDIRESVAFLTLLTRQLQHHYTVSYASPLCIG